MTISRRVIDLLENEQSAISKTIYIFRQRACVVRLSDSLTQ